MLLTPPSGRVAANDEKVLLAAERLLLAGGWSAFALAPIAREAGLSNSAVRKRFADPGSAAAALWHLRLAQQLLTPLEELLDAAGLFDAAADPERFSAQLHAIAHAPSAVRAAAELIVVAHYTPVLAVAIAEDLGAALRAWSGPAAAESEPVRATQRAFLVANAIGWLLGAHRRSDYDVDVTPVAAGMLASFAQPGPILELQAEPAAATRDVIDFGSGDEGLEALLNATLERIASLGFDGASTVAIAQQAGFTEGFLFRRYPSKAALFADALSRLQAVALRENAAIAQALAAERGAAYAEAMAYRDGLLPERSKGRTLALEFERVSARLALLHESVRSQTAAIIDQHAAAFPQLPAAQRNAAIFSALASGTGMAALPLLLPSAVQLPFSVVSRAAPGGS